MEKRKNKVLGLRMRQDLVDAFREYCAKERRDLSAQMEIIIEHWLEAQKKSASEPTSKPSVATPLGKIKP